MSTTVNSKNRITALVEEVDPDTVESWRVYIGSEIETCDNWVDAHGHMLDALKFWFGYYSVQLEDAIERGLTWTAEEYDAKVEQYEEWIDFFQEIEDTPQEVNLIGSNRKLSIIPKKERSDG